MKNTLERINSRITEAEERINDLEDRMVEITSAEQNIGGKGIEKNVGAQGTGLAMTKCHLLHVTQPL